MRDFDDWLNTFTDSINGYDYYVDFKKVHACVEKHRIEIHMLNSLVGSKDIEADFEKLILKYPECLKVVPVLLAVRSCEIFCRDVKGSVSYQFDTASPQAPAEYKYFMRRTGLFDLLENHIVSNLCDYVTGVEVGLDSNGRKNRGGHQMESLVGHYLSKAGFDVVDYSLVRKNPDAFPTAGNGNECYREMYLHEIENRWEMDLSSISSEDTSKKRWDFVVKTARCVYVIETNFYTGGGSKLNETARSYKMIAEEAMDIKGFRFVWITDGAGWRSARGNLEETFKILPTLFNINDMEQGIFRTLLL